MAAKVYVSLDYPKCCFCHNVMDYFTEFDFTLYKFHNITCDKCQSEFIIMKSYRNSELKQFKFNMQVTKRMKKK